MALQALLYSADGKDRALTRLDGLHPEALGPRQLLWVDVCDPTPAELEAVAARLGCESRLFRLETDRQDRPSLANFGELFRVTAAAVDD